MKTTLQNEIKKLQELEKEFKKLNKDFVNGEISLKEWKEERFIHGIKVIKCSQLLKIYGEAKAERR